jgi:hypothetical protein
MTDAEMCAELCAINDLNQLSWPAAIVVVAVLAAFVMVARLFFGKEW